MTRHARKIKEALDDKLSPYFIFKRKRGERYHANG